jgi:F-type H+-transporting ATPase subunit epsilon
MADETLELDIVSPERLLVTEKVDQVNIPGSEGDMGILPNHAPIISTLRPGSLSYQIGEKSISLVVTGGFVEVADNKVIVLASTAEFTNEIDNERALSSKVKAEESLAKAKLSEPDFEEAQLRLFRATARLENTDGE